MKKVFFLVFLFLPIISILNTTNVGATTNYQTPCNKNMNWDWQSAVNNAGGSPNLNSGIMAYCENSSSNINYIGGDYTTDIMLVVSDSNISGFVNNEPNQGFYLIMGTNRRIYRIETDNHVAVRSTLMESYYNTGTGYTIDDSYGNITISLLLNQTTWNILPPEIKVLPHFQYTISPDRFLTMNYTFNSISINDFRTSNLHNFNYTVMPSNDTYNNYDFNNNIKTEDVPINGTFNYQFKNDGYFVVMVNFEVTIPGKPLAVETRYFNFHIVNGQFVDGNTEIDKSCTNNTCFMPNENCGALTNFMESINCTFNKNINKGILNPSINAFKNIIRSFNISDTPVCGFNLPDANITTNRIFPMSDLPSSICTSGDTFRSNFPIFKTLINFSFALTNLYLLITIYNKALRIGDDDNVIDGIK